MGTERARHVGCSLQPTPGGRLRFRFRWPLPGEDRAYYHGETTDLRDTSENRERLSAVCERIGEQIHAGTFDYLAWFPNGRKALLYERARAHRPTSRETVRNRYGRWIDLQEARVAHTTLLQYRSHFGAINPILGDRPVSELTRSDVEFLRSTLVAAGKSQKHVKNIVGGTFRAFVRDAIDDGLLERDPFQNLRWKRVEFEGADPYSHEERDAGLEVLRKKTFRVGRGTGSYEERTHFPYYVAAYTIAWTGMRPEEVVALQVHDFEPKRPGFLVRRASVAGQVGATKTLRAERWVAITPETAELVKLLIPLRAKPKDWIFKAPEGGRIDQAKLGAAFTEGLRCKEIRERGLYSLKDTFCSLYISSPGATWEWLSEQTGVAITTLRRHYARFERQDRRDAEELRRLTENEPAEAGEIAPRGSKSPGGAA